MKTGKFNLGKALKTVLFSLLFVTASYSQDFAPPKPVESAYFDKWVGEWTGENVYNGQPGKQTIVAAWDFNHQFLVVNVTGTNDNNPNLIYRGTGYYTVDNEGNYVGYWFDIFGINGLSESKGKITNNRLEGSVSAPGYTGTEFAEFKNDNDVTMGSKSTYEHNGQKMQTEHTATYKRKK